MNARAIHPLLWLRHHFNSHRHTNTQTHIHAALGCLLALFLAAPTAAFSEGVTLAPTYPSVGLGGSISFSASGAGTASGVTWFAGGVKGGNTVAGTIDANGLYTAPSTMPGQNPVQVTAVSNASASQSATTYVYLLTPGPTITAVTPNPVPVGTVTVRIKGSGFLSGATVYEQYGANPRIQYAGSNIGTDGISATIYQGSATSATFWVKNPGSDYSNPITVPVAGAQAGYALSVVNGTGSGTYAAGTVVPITANPPGPGQSFLNWTGAAVAGPTSPSTTLTMPAANVSVKANYTSPGTYSLTVVNGSGSGSYLPGTVVTISANQPPAGQAFLNWTGAAVQNPTSATTTLTMGSASATVTASYYTPSAPVPYPVSSHPRLWVTPQDLPRLRSWAAASNPVYAQGMAPLLNQAVNIYQTHFFPNGVQNPNYPDPGDSQGYVGDISEEYGMILAFNSLIDPSPANRIQYAQYARNLLMVAMNQATLGHLANAPFRDPLFATYNRANANGQDWPLIVDWIYNTTDSQGNPILTAADKATIRQVFLMWANDCINAYTTGGDHPSPIGAANTLQLLPNNKPYRMAANNYYLGHARLLTMMALCIDPAEDPAINPGLPASQFGNSLRSFITNATGAWLYQEFAMYGDPAAVANAYGIPGTGAGLGLASGGLPPEGMLYGHSYGYLLGELLALQTAGFNNPTYAGPQIGLIGAPMWDRFVTGYFSSMSTAAQVPPSEAWLGPVYGLASYGDLLRLYVTPDAMPSFGLLALLEQENGSTAHRDAARWFTVNAVEGGAAQLMQRISQPFTWGAINSVLSFMLLDPTLPPAPDPRPNYPTVFYDAPAGRLLAHSDWSPTATLFDYRASWISINHQDADGGQFEFLRHGEWLTKEMSNYDSSGLGQTSRFHNTLALQNYCAAGTPNLNWFEGPFWTGGSQWILGLNAGDPTTVTSDGPGYVYVSSNLTPLYNRPNIWTPSQSATNITQATRSVVWLNNDYIVVYDRATSLNSGLFKRFNLCLPNNPMINGNTATETLASGQQLFVQSLLPKTATLSASYAAGSLSILAELEPTQYILTAEDLSNPSDVRFLHVLQGADPGAAMTPASYLQSTQGTPFDGAAFGATAVYFPVNASGPFNGVTLPAPAGVHTLLVTGLTPGAAYVASVQYGPNGATVTITPGPGAPADPARVLSVSL